MVHKTDEWSDEELMARAVCGGVESFAILVQRYEKNLYQHLYQILDNPANAADAFQETFLWIRLHMNSYVCGASFQSWLYEIANNLCQERVFKAKRTTSFLRGNLPDDRPPAGLAKRTVSYVERTAAKRKKISTFLRFAKGVAAALTAVLILGVVTWFAIPFIPGVREVVRRPECQKNLEQMGVVFQMYLEESKGEKFPPGICVDGIWTVDLRSIYPKYLADPNILICPSNKDSSAKRKMKEALEQDPPNWNTIHRLMAEHYVYLPWFIKDEGFLLEFINLPNMSGLPPDEDIDLGEHHFHCLREGVEGFYIRDIGHPTASAMMQFNTPIAFDNPGTVAHIPKGINVLYMDGHVEFVEYGSKYPATQAVWDYYTEKTAALKNEP